MSTPINDGGAAFPRPVSFSEEGGTHRGTLGMTLRDYFAGQVMAGALQDYLTPKCRYTEREVASRAYRYADAMLFARESKEDAT